MDFFVLTEISKLVIFFLNYAIQLIVSTVLVQVSLPLAIIIHAVSLLCQLRILWCHSPYATAELFDELKVSATLFLWTLIFQLSWYSLATTTATATKRHSKSEFALQQILSRLFHLAYLVKCWQFFCSWILKDCIKGQEKKKKVVVLCSRPRQKVKLGSFTL